MPTNNIAQFRGDLRDWILDTTKPVVAYTTFTVTDPASATLSSAYDVMSDGDTAFVESTGALPAGLDAAIPPLYVVNRDDGADTFELSTAPDGSGIVAGSGASGTLTIALVPQASVIRAAAALALVDQIGSRLYWGRKPQATTLPLVVLRIVSHDSPLTFSRPQEIMTTRVQADIHAASGADMDAVRDALVARLHDLEGVTQGTTTLLSIAADNQIDDFSEAADNWLASVDFMVRHKQTV